MAELRTIMDPCPDCGAMVMVPVWFTYTPTGSARIAVDHDRAMLVWQRHLSFNPEIHPSFCRRTEP